MGRHALTPDLAASEGWYSPNTNGGLCMCGCGQRTRVSRRSCRTWRTIMGESLRFIKLDFVSQGVDAALPEIPGSKFSIRDSRQPKAER